jgi:hypothetical protein
MSEFTKSFLPKFRVVRADGTGVQATTVKKAPEPADSLIDWEVIHAGDVPSLPKGPEPITPSKLRKMKDEAEINIRLTALAAHYCDLGRACCNVSDESNALKARLKQVRAAERQRKREEKLGKSRR